MVSLGYLKSAERLTVVVIKARNLPAVNIKGTGQWRFVLKYFSLHDKLEDFTEPSKVVGTL